MSLERSTTGAAHLFRPAGTLASGRDPVVLGPEEAGWSYAALHVLTLAPGEERTVRTEGFEAVVLPLSGACEVRIEGSTFTLHGREDVFSRVTDVAYLPVASEAVLTSDAGSEVALPMARAERRFEPRYVPAEDVRVEVRGAGISTRQVTNFLSADAFEADRLIAVEVLSPSGNWSSWPPHKHDERSESEVPLEEVYYYRVAGPNGFGIHRTYTLDGEIDATVTVRDGDVFLVPRGFHGPCIAAPGHDLYYLNVMAGPDERAWKISYDPSHEGVMEAWKRLELDPRCPMTSALGRAEPDAQS
jgi:5-deoxy-glucuronate isomerase